MSELGECAHCFYVLSMQAHFYYTRHQCGHALEDVVRQVQADVAAELDYDAARKEQLALYPPVSVTPRAHLCTRGLVRACRRLLRSWRCLLHRSRPEPRALRAPSLGNNP